MNFPSGFEGVYDHIIVHCAATPPSLDEGASWLDRVHRQKGWSRCGYHAVIRRDGTLEWELTGHRTRPIGKPGAHVGGCGPGWNERSFGICLMGGVKEDGKTPENNFTEEQLTTLINFIVAAEKALGVNSINTFGHRDLIKMTNAAPKACPCFSVREWRDGWTHDTGGLELYDRVRSAFNWAKGERPPPSRGDKLRVPRTYTVREGDTLWGISRTLGVRLQDIRSKNGLSSNTIHPGQKLRLL
jgi:hypothetical protein